MKSHYNRQKSNQNCYETIMKVKSEIDVIREEKDLEEDHPLSHASRFLDLYLDALEEQEGRNRD